MGKKAKRSYRAVSQRQRKQNFVEKKHQQSVERKQLRFADLSSSVEEEEQKFVASNCKSCEIQKENISAFGDCIPRGNGDIIDGTSLFGSFSSSESDDDDEDVPLTFAELFSDAMKPTQYEMANDDSYALLNRDDDNQTEMAISFCVSNQSLVALYEGTQYNVGYLDLNQDQRPMLENAVRTPIHSAMLPSIILDRTSVIIDDVTKVLCVKRIADRPNVASYTNENTWLLANNMQCIQFSKSMPLLAKYNGSIYFVGAQHHNEYLLLLNRAVQPLGTAIRISGERVVVDRQKQLLDVCTSVTYQDEKIFIGAAPAECNNNLRMEFDKTAQSDGIRRYMVSSEPFIVQEVDVNLIYASPSDNCTEIYAVNNFFLTLLNVNGASNGGQHRISDASIQHDSLLETEMQLTEVASSTDGERTANVSNRDDDEEELE